MEGKDDLVDLICRETSRVIREGIDRVESCAWKRVSCEGWLKIELLHAMTAACHGSARGVQVELGMDGRGVVKATDFATGETVEVRKLGTRGERVDLAVLEHASGTVLVQLKTFPTNYGSAGKPITKFITDVIADLRMLEEKRQRDDLGLAVWLAYPIPAGQRQWARHLDRVSAEAARLRHEDAFELGSMGQARLYVMESR